MKETILITGASGFIGTNLTAELSGRGYRIIGLSRDYFLSSLGLDQFKSEDYIPLEGDITNPDTIREIFAEYNPQFIIHLAAQALVGKGISGSAETFDVNIKGTWNILEACKKLRDLKHIIVASSDKAYGEHAQLPYKEDFELKAIFPYELSKKIAEELALSYFHTYGLPVSITRCGNVFGPYDLNKSRIVPGTILSCLRNEQVILRSDGNHERCYVFVRDVTRAYLQLMEAPLEKVSGQVFNIGNNQAISVIAITKLICEKMGKDPSLNILIENTSKYEISSQSLDCSKAWQILGWEAAYSLEVALDETIAWYSSIEHLH
jgi:CDP-glucose 4,6-dehydratase